MNVFEDQLASPLARGAGSLPDFFRGLAACPFAGSAERAIWGGFHADRLGYAFAAGYDAALRRAFELASLPEPTGVMCFAATEARGAHPRAIATRLDERNGQLVLTGEKTFVTLGTIADELLVVASRGTSADGRNRLCVVRVARSAAGISVAERAPTPFAPEIPHAVVRFSDVFVDAASVLHGDGYEAWLKPFRTLEDTHVLAATVGYLTSVARAYAWDHAVLVELVAIGAAIVELGARDPNLPLTHIVLAGLFAAARRLVGALDHEWEKADAAERERWQRDLPLLLVAENARTKRTEAALAKLSSARAETGP